MKINFRFANVLITTFMLTMGIMFSNFASAQINAGGLPMSSMTELNDVFGLVTMPGIDTQSLIDEDAENEKIPGTPFRYGYNFDVNYNLSNSGTWETLSDGSRVWRLAVRSEDAVSINLAFKDFYMPKGATFFVYNLGKNTIYGAFTEQNNSEDGYFATTPTYGSTTVLEYYEPVYSKDQGRITIYKVTHAYKDIFGYNSVLEEPCNININCPIGSPWVEQKRSVTRITFSQGSGSFLCSGSLLNSTLGDRQPYYLYAEHCATDNYSTMVFYFNYENPTCIGTLGTLSQTMSGATLKSENFDTDFRLVLLNQPVPATYNAYYNGWDRSNAQPVNQTAIHHPDGAVKKISIDNQPANTVTGFGGRLTNGFWLVVWDEGMTEGGSSGCPIFDQNHRVIGQNLGGTPANCSNPQAVQKYFGKFSESWAHGGAAGNQLKDWLDPGNTGVMTVDGIDAVTGIAPITNFTANTQVLPITGGSVDFFDMSTNGPTSWSWSFPGATPSTSTDRNPGGISYTATGNYTVSLTTTNAFGSNLKTVVAYIKVQGVPLSTFALQTPPNLARVIVNSNDPTSSVFTWGVSNPSPTVKYSFKIKKVGTIPEDVLTSDNGGLATEINIRKSFLDSLAVRYGTTGDSVLCAWRVTAFNGADSVTTNSFIVNIKRDVVGINQISSALPEKFNLYNNYPNPFNPSTNIKFDIIKNDRVLLVVYNMLGEKVATLVDQNLSPGSYNVDFNASSFSSGMYFYRIETQDFSETKRMALVK
ncbi:MAG: T9SS type A sorting domain-containing protein [Ignavibacteria bacterium]|nr:T9SS type A sorting domain-containing protein [Ignavibacteria bacterium]